MWLSQKLNHPQLPIRTVAQREVLLAEQTLERRHQRLALERRAHLPRLAHLAAEFGAALAGDFRYHLSQRDLLDLQGESVLAVVEHPTRRPGLAPGDGQRERGDQQREKRCQPRRGHGTPATQDVNCVRDS